MVKIAKGNLVNTVPKSAFDNFFKSQGWKLVGGDYTPPVSKNVEQKENNKSVEESVPVNSDEEINDEEWDEALDELSDDEAEKPLSEMNKDELTAKAKGMGIDVSNLTTNKQLREAIKSFK